MLNVALGNSVTINERSFVLTREGVAGHAVYGPYQKLEAGRYVVEFTIRRPEGVLLAEDEICAWVDVTADHGQREIADAMVRTPQLSPGGVPIRLAFTLSEPAEVEYRVYVNGRIPLLVGDDPVLMAGTTELPRLPKPPFLIDQRGMARRMYAMGARIEIKHDHVVVEIKGVRLNARIYDDVNFVHEIFVLSAYNLKLQKPTCIIDVGLNVGLASLMFATKPFVAEIHAFEPFAATRERALANIALNPNLAEKIRVNSYGLGDRDGDLTFRIQDNGDSGAMSTLDYDNGELMIIPMRDAGGALRPIIESARERGMEVIVKVDCEGSEFPVFASLAETGLLSEIRGFMVEWHRMFADRTQDELIAPLLAHDYVVFDMSPPTGNGFFYAARFD